MLPEAYLPVNRRRSLEEWFALQAASQPSRVRRVAPIPEAPTVIYPEGGQASIAGALPEFGGLTRQRRVLDGHLPGRQERKLPTGQTLNGAMVDLPTARTTVNAPIAPAPESNTIFDPNDPKYRPGERYEGLSPLGRKLAELRARQQGAQYETGIRDTGTAFEVTPPATRGETNSGRNRLKQALLGLLHGAAMAAQGPTEGAALRALGGAATGAAAGGISPRLMQAFIRQQEINRARGEAGAEQEIALGQARIAETQAEAAQRAAQPELEALRIQRQIEEDQRREDDRLRRSGQAAEANEIRRKRLEEQERHNRAVEGKTGATEEITVAGRKFKVSPNTAARILEERRKVGNKPDPSTESRIEADLEQEAGMDHLAKRKAADEQASALREEREKLTHRSMQKTDAAEKPTGTWEWKEDPAMVRRNATRIKDLDRQIAEAERESSYRQTEADQAFDRRNKAKAKAGTRSTAASGGRGAVAEDQIRKAAADRGLDPEVAVQRARSRGLLK